jgi:hypothetical protein
MGLTGLVNNITILGGKITELEIMKKMLHVALKPLDQVAISIKTLLDLDNLSVEEVTGHLRNVEQRKKSTAIDKQGRLLLTEEEWRAGVHNRNNGADGGGSNDKGRKKQPEKKKDSGDGPTPVKCLNCGKKGHLPKDCWSKPKKGEAHVAQTEEEEEPSLFLVSAVSQIFPKSPTLEQSGHGAVVDHDSSKAQAEEQLGLRVSDAPDQHKWSSWRSGCSPRLATRESTKITDGGSSIRGQQTT